MCALTYDLNCILYPRCALGLTGAAGNPNDSTTSLGPLGCPGRPASVTGIIVPAVLHLLTNVLRAMVQHSDPRQHLCTGVGGSHTNLFALYFCFNASASIAVSASFGLAASWVVVRLLDT